MLKSFVQYIVGMAEPHIKNIDGETYSDKSLHRIVHIPYAEKIRMNTLSSLIHYITSGIDTFSGKMIIHVQSPTCVSVYSALDVERNREEVVEVRANVPEFSFNQFVDHEAFCIGVQSKFINHPETEKALLLKFAGTVEAGTVAEDGDDGTSQKATVKTGIAAKGDALVPNPVFLCPYRTFVEVEQPCSSFIFRMKDDKFKGIQCALFEADGGAWKIRAMDNIRLYLTEALKEYPDFIVIS